MLETMERPESPFQDNGSISVKAQWPEQKEIRPPSRKGFRPKSTYRRPLPVIEEAKNSVDAQLSANMTRALEELVRLRPANPVRTLALLLFETQGITAPPGSDEEARELAALRIQQLARSKKARKRVKARRRDKEFRENGPPEYGGEDAEAVATLQRVRRGNNARQRVHRIKHEGEAAFDEEEDDYEEEGDTEQGEAAAEDPQAASEAAAGAEVAPQSE